MTLTTVTKISFLFITLTTSYFSTTLAIEAVLDVNGSPVKPNVLYYIKSMSEPSQWVSRGKRVLNTLCPEAALLTPDATAVKILVDTKTSSVPLSPYTIRVKFDGVGECNDSGIWKVASDFAHKLPIPDVTATGTLNDADSVFKIEKYEDGYKFNTASDVSIDVWEGHLGLVSNSALKVGFVEAFVA